MISIGPLLGAVSVLVIGQFMKNKKPLPLVWQGVIYFFMSIMVITLFWSPGQGVQNIGLVPAGLFFLLGIVYEIKAWKHHI